MEATRLGGAAVVAAMLAGLAGGVCSARPAAAADVALPSVVARQGVLNLRTGDVTVAALPNALEAAGFAPGRHVLVTDGPMTPERRAALSRAGVRLLSYLPLNAWIADVSGSTPRGVGALGFVTWAGAFRAEWKLEPALLAGVRAPQTPERRAIAQDGRVLVWVHLFADGSREATLAGIGLLGGARVMSDELVGGSWMLGVDIARDRLGALASLEDVQFVEEFPEYTLRSNAVTRWVVQSNVQNVTPLYARGLTGLGEIIGVIDGRVGVQHCAFFDSLNPIGVDHRKIVAYNATPGYNLHGTHVATTALGDAGSTGDTRGVAYQARMAFNTHPDATELSMYERFETHVMDGAHIHTNSWGADWTREYDGGCRGIDSVQRDFPDILIVHAVSNSATVNNPENAKNSLAVTASVNAPNQQNWCDGGDGPTQDGRRKPEIAAPGCAIQSASGSTGCGTTTLSGTSMATPAVAGVATLVRQYYLKGFYPSGLENPSDALLPSGQLIKATLVNSAVDMAGVADFPSNREGWGRVLADEALYFAGDARRLVVEDVRNTSPDAISTGDVASVRLSVGAGQALKVTMSYADAPAEVNATFVPVNDLDLEARSPSGVVYLGNVFSGGQSTPGGTPDTLNNLEQVLISAPESGEWTIRVRGRAVNVGMQGYALAITGDVAPIVCDPDVNADGNIDQDDIVCLIQTVGGGACAQVNPDFNGDGNVDQDDVALLTLIVAGVPCP
ncbi:MAG: S8 family serine peptidase [Planctomycetota bacterium]|nr:S8 family serine peptidase [Planctomycetota bacterium]